LHKLSPTLYKQGSVEEIPQEQFLNVENAAEQLSLERCA
jgi:hypothetical protein